jgi:hypothetical protein
MTSARGILIPPCPNVIPPDAPAAAGSSPCWMEIGYFPSRRRICVTSPIDEATSVPLTALPLLSRAV